MGTKLSGSSAARALRDVADEVESSGGFANLAVARAGGVSTWTIVAEARSFNVSGPAQLEEDLRRLRQGGASDPRAEAALIVDFARGLLGTKFSFGDRKVFLSAIFGKIRDRDMSDVEALVRKGYLRVTRADLVSAMDFRLVSDSTWDRDGTTAHFLELDLPRTGGEWR